MADPRNNGASAAGRPSLVHIDDASNNTTTGLVEHEICIGIWRDKFARFEGTADQLRTEGLIPDGFKWPRARVGMRWEASGFDYWLRRTRPVGFKGSMKAWLILDNWFIRVEVSRRSQHDIQRLELARKSAELVAEYYHLTAAGRHERDASWKRYFGACEDKDFQAFKALIPGLIPPKRGRKAKATTSGVA